MIRIGNLLRRRPADEDFAAELEAHVLLDTERGKRAGLSEQESRRQALLRLGGLQQTREAQNERAGLPWLESLARDFRYGVRTLAKRPTITAIAMLSIGLGIGANATVFSIVNRLVLRPAPVGDPDTLLSLHILQKGENCCNAFPLPLYNDVRDQARSFSGVAAYHDLIPASIGGSGEPERVWGQGITTNFFDVAEMPMVLGRGLAPDEDQSPVVVLSARLWQRRFNSDEHILGKAVTLSGHVFTVVGIAPAAFHSIDQILDTQFWVPLGVTAQLMPNLPPSDSRDNHWLDVIARLKPGVDRNQAAAELDTLSKRFAAAYPKTDKDNSFVFEQAGSLPPRERSGVLIFLTTLSVIPILLLAIAAANVANLLFAQAAGRQRELAVRLALGATRSRLRRQLLLESTLLGIGGGVIGALLSLWSTTGLSTIHLPAPVPLDMRVSVDWRGFLFTFALSVLCGMLLGAGPAWAASHPRLANALKGEDALQNVRRRFSLRNILVVTQIAMSVVLLSITVLFLRSLESAANINIGFRTQGLLLLSVDPRLHNYTPARASDFLAKLRHRVASLPGVDAAVCTDVPLLSGGNRSDGFTAVGESHKNDASAITDLYMVTPGYFNALGMPLLAGRDFANERANASRVAVVNKAFVDRLFGQTNPIGQHVSGGDSTYEIIGVVANSKSRTVGEADRPILYRSLDQTITADPSLMGYTLVVHTRGNPASLASAVRMQVHELDPAIAIYNEETMQELLRSAYFLPRVAAMLFGTFGGIGLVLAAVGLYGVMSYGVSRRTREIGIRMAMGAQPGSVERLVIRQGIALAVVAVLLGWPAAWMLAKLASSFLYGIAAHDVFTFATVPVLLVIVAFAACWLPARRAASVNPTEALRAE
jgi:predicted permease